MNHEEFLSGVLTDLNSPPESMLPLHLCLRKVSQEDQRLQNDLELSGNNGWSVQSKIVTIGADNDTVPIPVAPSQFGRALWAERQLEMNGRRRVHLVDLEDQDAIYGQQNPSGLAGGIYSEATSGGEEIAVFRGENGQPMVRVSPWPTDSITYLIYYSKGELEPPRLNLPPTVLQKCPSWWVLLHSRVVVSLIAYCRHMPEDQRAEIKADHIQRLDEPVNGLVARWNRFRRMDTGETDTMVEGFRIGRRRRMGSD